MAIYAFITLIFLTFLIGYLAAQKNKNTAKDYLLADQNISPSLIALSSVASKYSGYMFVGLIGYIYHHGFVAVWIIFGFFVGDLCAWFLVYKKIKTAVTVTKALTVSSLISLWHGQNYRFLHKLIAVISLVFLIVYSAAQLSAGGKSLVVLFDWRQQLGVLLAAILVLSYCLFGGLRASIWTDVIQALLMIISLITLLCSAIFQVGSIEVILTELANVSPTYVSFKGSLFDTPEAIVLFALGWIFNGFGTLGQPHVVIRLMALDPQKSLFKTGLYYFTWSVLFLTLIFVVGLLARFYLPNLIEGDAELALPLLAQALLPDIIVGIIIAGIFSSVISTADSQILSCSAILTEDFRLGKSQKSRYIFTLCITLFACLIAIVATANVFSLVIFSWSALASSLGPLIIILSLGYKPTQMLSVLIVFSGLLTSILWRINEWHIWVYEGLPGMLVPLCIFILSCTFFRRRAIITY